MTHPIVELQSLDELWFQITGTRCNLRCTHCFISCAPDNTTFGYLDVPTVTRLLQESIAHGVKEYYFTGGEPFLHPDMIDILEMTLALGPATVLTNGTIMTPPMVHRLRRIADASLYSLEFRVSIDHFDESRNDAIRGRGSYRKALAGARRLAEAGFLPIVTAMRTWPIDDDLEVIDRMSDVLRSSGISRPRIKFLPALKIGAEADRSGGYSPAEYVTEDMMVDFPVEQLVCSHSRIVTDRGVHVCPILIETPDSVLGATLREASRGFPLRHQACTTCYLFGSICTNPTAVARETGLAPGVVPAMRK
jgi:AdoMet-dependent heme synthase